MISIPIFEAKNKLTQFLRMVEDQETDGVEITRHGKAVAVLCPKDSFIREKTADPFSSAYKQFRTKLTAISDGMTESEWNDCFTIPRNTTDIRHPEDFE